MSTIRLWQNAAMAPRAILVLIAVLVTAGCIHGPSALDQKADRIETKNVDAQRAALKDSE